MPWPLGTVASNHLKQQVKARLEEAIESSSNKPIEHVEVAIDVDPSTSGVRVVVLSGADDQQSHDYRDPETGRRVLEEYHLLTVGVVCDDLSATRNTADQFDIPPDEAVFAIVRETFVDRDTLIALGIYNVRETAEGLDVGDIDFSRKMNVRCSTDLFLT